MPALRSRQRGRRRRAEDRGVGGRNEFRQREAEQPADTEQHQKMDAQQDNDEDDQHWRDPDHRNQVGAGRDRSEKHECEPHAEFEAAVQTPHQSGQGRRRGHDEYRDDRVAQTGDTGQRRDEIADRNKTDGGRRRKRQAHGGDRFAAGLRGPFVAMIMPAEAPGKPVPARQHRDHAEKHGTEQIVRCGCRGEE